MDEISKVKQINDLPSLVNFLQDDLNWDLQTEVINEAFFEYTPEEVGVDAKQAPKIKAIYQFRPLTDAQFWGIFYIDFETKKIPVVILHRILKFLIQRNRKASSQQKIWEMENIIFISITGEKASRRISFINVTETIKGKPEIRPFSWDKNETSLNYMQNKLDFSKLKWPEDPQDLAGWKSQWSAAFHLAYRYVVKNSEELARAMAFVARNIRELIFNVYHYESEEGPLHKVFSVFSSYLVGFQNIKEFADTYAQTITYGLFTARVTKKGEFEYDDIEAMIPSINPFLCHVFEEFSKLNEYNKDKIDIEEIGVLELVKLLYNTDLEAIMQDFGRQMKKEDPVISFYEHFLKEYDSTQRIDRGVFFTPDPVVDFIVRGVDYFLRNSFKIEDGLADATLAPLQGAKKEFHRVEILDPATGTGTFLKSVIEEIYRTLQNKNREKPAENFEQYWNSYVNVHLLPRLFGFELLLAPYAVAHLKLGLKLKETGYSFTSNDRLNIFLTNTLNNVVSEKGSLDKYFEWVLKEAFLENEVKNIYPISVILGNPPYKGHSMNKGFLWIEKLVDEYKKIGGREIEISQGKWLKNDYVKFIRFAQWKLSQTGHGILAFITDNSFLRRSVFRAMRKHLRDYFDEIYIVNLHGNSKIQEKGPGGEVDFNVFDITQGVAISFFIKSNSKSEKKTVQYADLYGSREKKYAELSNSDFPNLHWTNWQEFSPESPMYLFFPQTNPNDAFYSGWMMNDVFIKKRTGFNSMQDELAVAYEKEDLIKNIIKLIISKNEEDARKLFELCKTSQWNYETTKVKLSVKESNGEYVWMKDITRCLYRPFDSQWTVYNKNVIPWRREEVNNILYDNRLIRAPPEELERFALAIITTPNVEVNEFTHAFISSNICALHAVSVKESNHVFPLFQKNKTLNLNVEFIADLKKKTKLDFRRDAARGDFSSTFGPYDILYYIYGILYSNLYRERYNDFLSNSFPVIPLPLNNEIFKEIADRGRKLALLHLLADPDLNQTEVTLSNGDNNVMPSYPDYKEEDKKVWINKTQYFDNIEIDVWEYNIGGASICEKWLADRRGRVLTLDEIERYKKIVASITKTISIMDGIDELLKDWPLSFEKETSAQKKNRDKSASSKIAEFR